MLIYGPDLFRSFTDKHEKLYLDLKKDYDTLTSDYDDLFSDYYKLYDDYDYLYVDYNSLWNESPLRTTISGTNVYWDFYDSKGNYYY